MKAILTTYILLLCTCGTSAFASTWKSVATTGGDLQNSIHEARVEDGIFTSKPENSISSHWVSKGTVEVVGPTQGYSRVYSSIESTRIEINGLGSGEFFDTLTDFTFPGAQPEFHVGYMISFMVDPYHFPYVGQLPIATLSFAIKGGGVENSFILPITHCPVSNQCALSDRISFPKATTNAITVEMSFSTTSYTGYADNFWAELRYFKVADICLDGPFLDCPVSYRSASGVFRDDAKIPLPPTAALLSGSVLGLAGLRQVRRKV